MMSSNKENNKMNGLLKGLRYISKVFDDEKKQDIQIGFPMDVKHVAHIGWDGGASTAADSSPGWMNDLQAPQGGASSGPLAQNGEIREEESSRKNSKSPARESGDKPSKKQSSRSVQGITASSPKSPKKEKSDRHNKNKNTSKKSDSSEKSESTSSSKAEAIENTIKGIANSLPDFPKKTRRKKSKESANGEPTKREKESGTRSRAKTTSNEPPSVFQQGEE